MSAEKLIIAKYTNQVLSLRLPATVARSFIETVETDGRGTAKMMDVPEGTPYMTLSFSYPGVLNPMVYGTSEIVVTFVWETGKDSFPQVFDNTDPTSRLTLPTRNGYVLSPFEEVEVGSEGVWMKLEDIAKMWAQSKKITSIVV